MPETISSELSKKDMERKRNYTEYLDFYNGLQWQTGLTRQRRQLTFNYVKVFIDKITSYLMSDTVFAVDPVADTPDAIATAAAAEKAISKVVMDNNLEQLDFDTELDAAILGDGAYKVIWDPSNKSVRVTTPDVQGIYAWWVPDDPASVSKVASRYRLSPDSTSWTIEVWTDKTFELHTDDKLIESLPNHYGFIPFIIFPNLRQPKQFWGLSDIPDLMGTQRELNRALTQVSRILELSGNPITVLENVSQAEDISVEPGSVWQLPEEAKAYLLNLLEGGGVKLHIDYIELLYRIMHDTSESPKAAYGRTERDLSGVALEIEMQPLMQKIRRKRLIRTTVYRKRNQMILSLLKTFTGTDLTNVSHRIAWGPVLPLDRGRMVQNETALVEKGIHSRRRAMDELGVADPQAELDLWLGERELILKQNQALSARAKGSKRESEAPGPGVEE